MNAPTSCASLAHVSTRVSLSVLPSSAETKSSEKPFPCISPSYFNTLMTCRWIFEAPSRQDVTRQIITLYRLAAREIDMEFFNKLCPVVMKLKTSLNDEPWYQGRMAVRWLQGQFEMSTVRVPLAYLLTTLHNVHRIFSRLPAFGE